MSLQSYRNDLIKGAMAAGDITVERLCATTRLSTDTIRRIRAGEINITLTSLFLVADALKLNMRDLFTPKAEAEAEKQVA